MESSKVYVDVTAEFSKEGVLIYQSGVYEEHEVYEYGLKELFVWMEGQLRNVLKICKMAHIIVMYRIIY